MTSKHRLWSGALALGAMLVTSPSFAQGEPAPPPPGGAVPASPPAPTGEQPPADPSEPPVVAVQPSAEEPAAPGGQPAEPAPVEPGPEAVPAQPLQPEVMPWAPPPALGGEVAPDAATPVPEGPYVPHWMWFDVGFRTYVIFNDGFDAFSDNEVLGQGAFTVGFTPLHFEPFGIGLTAEYDIGRKSHNIRGIDSGLTLHRLGVGVQGHADLGILRLFARATPAFWYGAATIDDASFQRPLVSSGFTWGFDATGGAAIRIASVGPTSSDAVVRFWLLLELGYGFAGNIDMTFAPEEDEDDPRQFGVVSLPPVRPAGMVNRFGFAVSF